MTGSSVKLPSISELTSNYSHHNFYGNPLTPPMREKARFLPSIEKDALLQSQTFTPRTAQSYNYLMEKPRNSSNFQKLPSPPSIPSFEQASSPQQQQQPYYSSPSLVGMHQRLVYPHGYYQPMYYQTLTPPLQHQLNPIVPEVINQPKDKCHRCGTTETPEWRRGPNGVRTLCNACGLFHAKLVKKKGAALAAEEVLNNKVCKGKNGRRISMKKQHTDRGASEIKEYGASDNVESYTTTNHSHQLVLPPPILSHNIHSLP